MSGLIRALTLEESRNRENVCCWSWRGENPCDAVPLMRLATPIGQMDYCRDHIDHAIADIPPDWLAGFAFREPVAVEGTSDDIPF